MDNPGWNKKLGATPGKLALASVLGMVLVIVIYYQFAAGNASVDSGRRDRHAAERTSSADQPPDHVSKTPTVNATTGTVGEWPEPSLETVLAHDPFALPPGLEPPTPDSTQPRPSGERADGGEAPELQQKWERALATVRELGIHMVLVGEQEQVALVGEQAVRVGEVLEGFRVVAIDADGLILSELPVNSEPTKTE